MPVLISKFLVMIGPTVCNHGYTGNCPDYFVFTKMNYEADTLFPCLMKQTLFFITVSQL